MAWTLLAGEFCFFIPETSKARIALVALFVFLFADELVSTFSVRILNLLIQPSILLEKDIQSTPS